jgi:hypothetical protein
MRFITRILLFGALVLTVPAALLAQRGAGTGSHGAAPAAHSFAGGGSHGFASSGRYAYPAVGTAPLGTIPPAASYTGIRPGALRSYGYAGRSGYGYGRRDFRRVPYGYFFAPYYDPYLGYSDSAFADYGNGPGYVYDPGADPNVEGAMADQLNRLTADVEQLKYGQQPAPPPYAAQDSQPAQPAVTLVLRNGQQLKVQNYAVMDQTFWDFTSQPTRKIPIANIDIAASVKATTANGGDFPQLDTVHDGQ